MTTKGTTMDLSTRLCLRHIDDNQCFGHKTEDETLRLAEVKHLLLRLYVRPITYTPIRKDQEQKTC